MRRIVVLAFCLIPLVASLAVIASEGASFIDEPPHSTSVWLNLVEARRNLYTACEQPTLMSFSCPTVEKVFANLDRVELVRSFLYKEGRGRKPMFETQTEDGTTLYLSPLSGYPLALNDAEAAARVQEDAKQLFLFVNPRAVHSEWPEWVWEAIADRVIRIGMTSKQVQLSWGQPARRNRSVGSWGVHEQWVYGDFGPYVYLKNGVVASWQS